MTSISINSNIGLAIPTYLADTRNEQSLAATWAKGNGQVQSDIAYFQSVAPTLTSADALMNNYRALQVVLGAYNVSDLLSYPGLVRQLLTQDPSSSTSTAQKIGNASYLNFAQALDQFSNNPFGTAGNVTAIVNAYVTNNFEVAQGNQIPGMQNALAFRRIASQITTIPELMTNQAALTVAVAQTGIDFTTYGNMSYQQQVAFLTSKIKLSDLQNPKTVDTMAEQYLVQAVQDPGDWNAAPADTNTVASLFGADNSTSLVSLFGDDNTNPVLSLFA
jgi:hypothetical protein